jgi:hypothetical protein
MANGEGPRQRHHFISRPVGDGGFRLALRFRPGDADAHGAPIATLTEELVLGAKSVDDPDAAVHDERQQLRLTADEIRWIRDNANRLLEAMGERS